jgi:hypothetical protein
MILMVTRLLDSVIVYFLSPRQVTRDGQYASRKCQSFLQAEFKYEKKKKIHDKGFKKISNEKELLGREKTNLNKCGLKLRCQ